MAFRLTLKPRERAVISGAVIRNGNHRTVLLVENEVPILREGDILSPREVHTPSDRVVLAIQLMYLAPEEREKVRETYDELVADLRAAAPSLARDLEIVNEHVLAGRYYQALRAARQLRQDERRLFNHVR